MLLLLLPLIPSDLWSVNAAKEEALYSAPHFYIFSPRDISIFFDKDIQSAPLRVTVQEYRQERSCSPTTVSAHRYAGFPAEHVPSHALLKSWVEDQIIREHQPVFEQSVQSFLLAYAAGDSSLPKVQCTSPQSFTSFTYILVAISCATSPPHELLLQNLEGFVVLLS